MATAEPLPVTPGSTSSPAAAVPAGSPAPMSHAGCCQPPRCAPLSSRGIAHRELPEDQRPVPVRDDVCLGPDHGERPGQNPTVTISQDAARNRFPIRPLGDRATHPEFSVIRVRRNGHRPLHLTVWQPKHPPRSRLVGISGDRNLTGPATFRAEIAQYFKSGGLSLPLTLRTLVTPRDVPGFQCDSPIQT